MAARDPDVLVVGAGIVGLMTAYHLVRRGARNVRIIDRAPSLLLGASGRNGGGIRAQWTSEENIVLARRSIQQFGGLAAATGHQTWWRPGGYLFLARTEDQVKQLDAAVRFQNAHGVRTRRVTPTEARDLVPLLNTDGLVGGAFNPDDGTLFPWPVVHGVAEWLAARGVRTELSTAVTGFRRSGGRVVGVETSRGDIQAGQVVLACGAWTREVAAMLGADVPTRPERHEILVTEALKPCLNPMLIDLSTGLYCSQAMRGELVGGMGQPKVVGPSAASSAEFLAYFSRALTRLLPRLGSVNVLRQWAGSYDMSPDHKPIIGRAPAAENVWMACGMAGHGFMIAPAVGEVLADLLLARKPFLDIAPFGLGRFEGGATAPETMVIG